MLPLTGYLSEGTISVCLMDREEGSHKGQNLRILSAQLFPDGSALLEMVPGKPRDSQFDNFQPVRHLMLTDESILGSHSHHPPVRT